MKKIKKKNGKKRFGVQGFMDSSWAEKSIYTVSHFTLYIT